MTWFAPRFSLAIVFALAAPIWAADGAFASFADVKPILEHYRANLPTGLSLNEASWNAWSRESDAAIRARLEQGDLDSMVNLLLFGVTFTDKPRITIDQMSEASRSGLLRGRLEDFLTGLHFPGKNNRLTFVRDLLKKRGYDVTTSEGARRTGVYILENLQRVLGELRVYGQRAESKGDAAAVFTERSRLFRDRGVSTDTSILPSYALEQTLGEIVAQGKLRPNAIARAAVIGPGLDFADWDGGYDVYPQQTIQPLGLYDSLVRATLSRRPSIRVLDISPRVLDHLRAARSPVSGAYDVNLLRDPSSSWLPDVINYWQSFGATTAQPAKSQYQQGLEGRAVQFPPAVLNALEPADANIVLQRLTLAPARRFDLIVATNIFVYYGEFEQALAAANVAAMLQPGGYLLTNNELPELPGGLHKVGQTRIRYGTREGAGDTFLWYQRASQ